MAQRNGTRDKLVATTAGDLAIEIPKMRIGSFFTPLLSPRRRIDVALHAVVMQVYVEGVTTRRVDHPVAALGGTGISKSDLSRICAKLDAEVAGGGPGRADGKREVLGCAASDSETKQSWTEFLRDLRDRGLAGFQLVVSDAQRGLTDAVDKADLTALADLVGIFPNPDSLLRLSACVPIEAHDEWHDRERGYLAFRRSGCLSIGEADGDA